jgi:O-antigen biosynthesis protein WbqP
MRQTARLPLHSANIRFHGTKNLTLHHIFDELPQLWSILKGDMSFVGPRPALFNQDDLIALRTDKGVHQLVPGLTGWAQINGRDELPIPRKVELDVEYLRRRSLLFDLKILWMTVVKVLARDGVSH